MGTITSANSVLTLAVTGLFTVPQQIQGFSTDDIYDTESIETAEVQMGVDGKLSAGFIFVPAKQSYSLQADSASNTFFETWYASEKAAREKLFANGIIILTSVNRKYAMTNGVLSNYQPLSDAKKVLQPRKFTITWESVDGVPF